MLRSDKEPSNEDLFTAFAHVLEWRIDTFVPQIFANTAWAFAAVNHSDEKLFVALAAGARLQVSGFKPQALGNMAWAFTTVHK